MEPPRWTRTQRRVAATVAGLLVLGVLVLTWVRLNRPADCTVRTPDRVVELDQRNAERAAVAVASVVRRGGSTPDATRAVDRALRVSSADAEAVATALTGHAQAALTCRHGGSSVSESDKLDARGLTRRAEAVRRNMLAAFGAMPMGGFAPGGVHTGHMPGSAHYEGRAVDVFFRPVSAANKTRGWALAQYLVAEADRLAIDTVIFDDRIWTARRGDEGWRDYRIDINGMSPEVVRVLQHRDHVHVDVAD
jgi:hypothetical protein